MPTSTKCQYVIIPPAIAYFTDVSERRTFMNLFECWELVTKTSFNFGIAKNRKQMLDISTGRITVFDILPFH